MASNGLRYHQVTLVCSANSGGASGTWVDCGRFRTAPWVQCANSGSDSGVSGTVILQGALAINSGATALVLTGTRGIRLASLAITAGPLDELTALLLSTVGGNVNPGLDTNLMPRYLRLVISTLSQGSPTLHLGGLVEDEHT